MTSPIVFEIKHFIGFHLEMVVYPNLNSSVKWVQKGIDLLERSWPGLLRYLSRQQVLARLSNHSVILNVHSQRTEKSLRRAFALWLRKERVKNLTFMILEGLLIPFTGFLALLPGPNIFFYVPGLLFYFHFIAWRGLRRAVKEDMEISIEYKGEFSGEG